MIGNRKLALEHARAVGLKGYAAFFSVGWGVTLVFLVGVNEGRGGGVILYYSFKKTDQNGCSSFLEQTFNNNYSKFQNSSAHYIHMQSFLSGNT